jgi:hypothetical protein
MAKAAVARGFSLVRGMRENATSVVRGFSLVQGHDLKRSHYILL